MKILINTPDLKLSGGVANHYRGLLPFWKLKVKYNYIGGRNKIPGLLILPFDLLKFLFKCLFGKYDLIILNPSLGKTALKRDAIFLKIAKLTKKKTIVFWHGWSPKIVLKINNNSRWFRQNFNYASMHLVLSGEFKKDLIKWGINKPIRLTTTKVDERLLIDFQIQNKEFSEFTILFLSRIEIYKGIFIVLEAYKEFLNQNNAIKLVIAGEGSQLNAAKEFTKKNNLMNVHFLGNLKGKQLIQAFKNANIYILPTYSEGMPTSVLEAMAFGLPVITRPVGGLNDFFQNGKMGFLIESLEPKEYVKKINYFLENKDKMQEMGIYNHTYVINHFLSNQVAKNLEQLFLHV